MRLDAAKFMLEQYILLREFSAYKNKIPDIQIVKADIELKYEMQVATEWNMERYNAKLRIIDAEIDPEKMSVIIEAERLRLSFGHTYMQAFTILNKKYNMFEYNYVISRTGKKPSNLSSDYLSYKNLIFLKTDDDLIMAKLILGKNMRNYYKLR